MSIARDSRLAAAGQERPQTAPTLSSQIMHEKPLEQSTAATTPTPEGEQPELPAKEQAPRGELSSAAATAPSAAAAAAPLSPEAVYFVPATESRFNPWLAALASRCLPYQIEYDDGERRIAVPADYAEKAREELAIYERINHDWPRQAPPDPQANQPLFSELSFFAALASALALFRFYLWVESTPALGWRERGLWRDSALAAGEWWRVLTALTLHADASHLLSNLFWMLALLALLGAEVGAGAAWAGMIAAGALGNAAMIALAPEGHAALGASTMVFGLLGMISAMRTWHSWRRRQDGRGQLLRILPWLPLLAGLAMLGIYGTAPGSDLLGHGCGFVAGLAIGALMPLSQPLLTRRWLQLALAGAAAILLLAAWLAAFAD
jgi:rhomboid protease GluP